MSVCSSVKLCDLQPIKYTVTWDFVSLFDDGLTIGKSKNLPHPNSKCPWLGGWLYYNYVLHYTYSHTHSKVPYCNKVTSSKLWVLAARHPSTMHSHRWLWGHSHLQCIQSTLNPAKLVMKLPSSAQFTPPPRVLASSYDHVCGWQGKIVHCRDMFSFRKLPYTARPSQCSSAIPTCAMDDCTGRYLTILQRTAGRKFIFAIFTTINVCKNGPCRKH